MARKIQVGWEWNSLTAQMEMTLEFPNSGTGQTIVTSPVRSGTYAYRHNVNNIKSFQLNPQTNNNTANYFLFLGFRYATLHTGGTLKIVVGEDTGLVERFSLRLTITGELELYNQAGTKIGGTSATMAANEWHRIEMQINTVPADGSEVLTARLNDTEFASSTAETLGSGVARITMGMLETPSNTPDFFFDDIILNDDSGSDQNSWVVDEHIVHLKPNADGDNTAMTGGFADVDEVTPNTTDYLETNTAEQIEDMNLEAAPAEIGATDVIKTVAAVYRFAGVASSANASFVSRIKAAASGTVDEAGTAIAPASTTYRTNKVSTPRTLNHVIYAKPGGGAWAKSDLDTAQLGFRCTAASTNAARISTAVLSVGYALLPGTPTNDVRDSRVTGSDTSNRAQDSIMAGGHGWYRDTLDTTTYKDTTNTTATWTGNGSITMT